MIFLTWTKHIFHIVRRTTEMTENCVAERSKIVNHKNKFALDLMAL